MEVFNYAPLAGISGWVLLVVRIAMAVVFLNFGWPKIKDLKKNAEDFSQMGFRPGWLFGTPIALLEVFGSIGLILGLFVWELAVLFALHMAAGTIWKITKTDKGFPDWSYDILLLVLALVLLAFGSGKLALGSAV